MKRKLKGERLTHVRRIAVVGKQTPRDVPQELDRYFPDAATVKGYVFKSGLLRKVQK